MNLADELVLLLLNEETGYFHQAPGWNLNCAVASAVLADLSFAGRIETDLDRVSVVDPADTGDPTLDSILKEIGAAPEERNTQYWIERLAPRAESVIDSTLARLVEQGILVHHTGGFWSLGSGAWQPPSYSTWADEETEFVKTRISRVLFDREIPHPRDAILVALVNACKALHLIYPLDPAAKERVRIVCRLDVVGRSIADAVTETMAAPTFRTVRPRPIPWVPVRDVLFSRHARAGNLPALIAGLAKEHGPVFRLRVPFMKGGMLVLAGPEVNRWLQRHGRSYLRSKDYLEDFERCYGASRILPSMDGADHFRMRKAIQGPYSRRALEGRLDELYGYARGQMEQWRAGDVAPAVTLCRQFMNAQFSGLSVAIDTQDDLRELLEFKARSLIVHVQHVLPGFMMKTPGMRRRKKRIDNLVERIRAAHTPSRRKGCPVDVVDGILGLHASDPQFLPETDLPFSVVSPLIVTLYLGNALAFALYNLLSRPDLRERIQAEADRVFADGDPKADAVSRSSIDLTYRFIMESQRLYPIIPMQVRTVMNSCVVEGYELPVGSRVDFYPTAAHYMEEAFPDPFSFDVDRYSPARGEERTPHYAPYGLGTHKCLGFQWVELQMAVSLLMILRFFRIELARPGRKLRINPFPTMAPTRGLKIAIAEKRHDLHGARPAARQGVCPVTGHGGGPPAQ